MRALRALLGKGHRLVTLTGAPGCGKTTLALAVAARLESAFEHGACFVDLTPVADPALVTLAALRALGLPDSTGAPTRALIAALERRALLLVLDNFEHVLAARTEVGGLLAACPRLRILVTSRRRLDLSGEREVPVPPLSVPDVRRALPAAVLARIPSVALFVRHARAVQPAFRLTESNRTAVAEICRRVDGLPLAVELAARRTKHYSPQEIAGQLGRGFALLAAGPQDLPERRRSVEASITWSYQLLDDPARVVLRRLSAFVGGATLESAREVCGEGADVADTVAALCDCGLLQRTETPSGRSRFRMLETIRDFALRRLAEAGEGTVVRRRHLEFFAGLASIARPHLGFFLADAAMKTLMDTFDEEYDNVAAALLWAGQPDAPGVRHEDAVVQAGLRLAVNLHWYWFVRGRFADARRALDGLLGASGRVAPPLRALGVTTAAYLACWQGDFAGARPLAEQGVEEFRGLADASGLAFALHALGFAALGVGDSVSAQTRVAEALRVARRAGDGWMAAFAVSFLGIRAEYAGDLDAARRMHEECITLVRSLGGHSQAEGYSRFHLARIARQRGDLRSARTHLAAALDGFRALGDPRGIVYCLLGLAVLAMDEGQAARTVRLLGALDAGRLGIGPILERRLERDHADTLARAQAALPADEFARLWAAGREMSLEEITSEAIPPPAAVPAARRRRTPLTAREEQVAVLIARGLTNRQIAATLVIGKKTADAHVQHIMDRLGFHSRAQIAAWAAEQRLIPPPNG